MIVRSRRGLWATLTAVVALLLAALALLPVAVGPVAAQGAALPNTRPKARQAREDVPAAEAPPAAAAPAPSPTDGDTPESRSGEAGEDETTREDAASQDAWFRRLAGQLDALIAGTLPAETDERTLFWLDMNTWPRELAGDLSRLLQVPDATRTQASDDADPLQDGAAQKTADASGSAPPPTAQASDASPNTAKAGTKAGTKAEPSGDGSTSPGTAADGNDSGAQAWLRALERWAALSPATRSQHLSAHRKRREQAEAQQARKLARDRELAEIKQETADLRSLMDRTLALDRDPTPLLVWDLSRWPELADGAADKSGQPASATTTEATSGKKAKRPPKRRARSKKAGASQAASAEQAPPPKPPEPLDEEMQAALAELQTARLALLALSPGARTALLKDHRARQRSAHQDEVQAAQQAANEAEAQAQAAAEARKRALLAAEQARTEAQRVIAAEHARLLGVDEAQARFGASLSQQVVDDEQFHSKVLERRLHVERMQPQSELDEPNAAEADALYEQVVADLHDVRTRLEASLSAITVGGAELTAVGAAVDLPRQPEATEVHALRKRLVQRERALLARVRDQRWRQALGLRQDMSALNEARLTLLTWLSAPVRARYTGTGADAVQQGIAEAEQIRLEMGVKALALPRELISLREDLITAPMPVVMGFLQFVIILAIFRAWRRNANGFLVGLRRRVLRSKPPWPLQAQVATGLWYLTRIRKPFESLLLLAVLLNLLGEVGDELGMGYVWVIAVWGLSGSAAVRFLDALAARQHLRSGGSSSAVLRIRSLRLSGLLIVGSGMLLSLVALMVGKGTVYGWVSKFCWLLAIPASAVLIRWWRPTVLSRIQARPEQTAFFAWVGAHTRGPRSYLTAAAGGLYLLAEGLWSWLLSEASEWELTRRLLAYLFRTEAARKAEAHGSKRSGRPLDEHRMNSLAPDQMKRVVLSDVWGEQLEALSSAIEANSCSLAVVTGERGIGKTIFLEKLAEQLDGEALHFSCPPDGIAGLLMGMRKELELGPISPDAEIAAAIDERAPKVVVIDDMQRAIRPAIGGLAPLDRIVSMARESSSDIAWVLSIASPAWNYVERARSERIAFDRTVVLKGWSEEHIGKLIRASSSIASIEPNFERLVMSRQMEDVAESASERAEKGYYRILWDYSGGNPALALHWFRRSLFLDDEDEVTVNLFRPPDAWDLEEVPLNVRFVLRAILQLDWAHPGQLADSLEMSRGQVDETIRFAQSRGYLERDGDRVAIAWEWLRAITVALKRQHLITT